jgi:hypothetical protein
MIRAYGTLTASDRDARTLTYRLLPFGEPGRTNVGTVTAGPGSVTLPDDPAAVVLNLEHERTRPLGRAVSLAETTDGLVAAFRVADTRAGDDLLAEAAEGLRTGVSVELDAVVIRDGRLVASVLTGAGAVVAPAFPSAQLVASDTEPDTEPDTDTTDTTDETDDEPEPGPDETETPEPDGTGDENGDTMDTTLTAAAVPGSVPGPVATTPAAGPSLADVNRMLAAYARGDRSPELTAALSDLTYTANAHVLPPQWVGEAWSRNTYERSVVPLLASGELTGPKVLGWRWKVAPEGATYGGDKAAVPSNAATTETVEWDAKRWAGAHDHDRIFADFGVAGYWESYWARMAASYSKWSDGLALTGIKASATAVTPADASDVLGTIVDAVLAVLPVGAPTFCLLGSIGVKALAGHDPLAFLSGTFRLPTADGNVGGLAFGTHPGLAAGDVIVGVRNAATWYELGSVPIRVNAVDLVKGGEDTGAFGYGVLGVHEPAGIVKATVTAAAPATTRTTRTTR